MYRFSSWETHHPCFQCVSCSSLAYLSVSGSSDRIGEHLQRPKIERNSLKQAGMQRFHRIYLRKRSRGCIRYPSWYLLVRYWLLPSFDEELAKLCSAVCFSTDELPDWEYRLLKLVVTKYFCIIYVPRPWQPGNESFFHYPVVILRVRPESYTFCQQLQSSQVCSCGFQPSKQIFLCVTVHLNFCKTKSRLDFPWTFPWSVNSSIWKFDTWGIIMIIPYNQVRE